MMCVWYFCTPLLQVGRSSADTDNWVWPRHTGDSPYSKIYAGKGNRPSCQKLLSDNVYHPSTWLRYPGRLSWGSLLLWRWAIRAVGTLSFLFLASKRWWPPTAAQIDVRGVKQAIGSVKWIAVTASAWKYASKCDESSNYWKNSIGVNRTIKKLHVLDKKRAMETEPVAGYSRHRRSGNICCIFFRPGVELQEPPWCVYRARAYFAESFPERSGTGAACFVHPQLRLWGEEKTVVANLKAIVEKYANLDLGIDKEVFTALLKEYRSQVDSTYLPELYQTIATEYGGNERTLCG